MSEGTVIVICWDCRRARALSRMKRCQACLDAMSKAAVPFLPGENYDPHGPDTHLLVGKPECPVVTIHKSGKFIPGSPKAQERLQALKDIIGVTKETPSSFKEHVISESRKNHWDTLRDLLRGRNPPEPSKE